MITRRNLRKAERGQVLILCAIFMVVLLLFVGLAVDFGMAYVTKAQLGKASDAAALTAARYSAQGPAAGTALAQSAFAMNYNSTSVNYDPTAPPPTVVYSTDASGNTLVNVNASATNKTFFARLLPGFSTLNVTSNAQSKAARVLMTLVLDRTGSMRPIAQGGDGGEAAIPAAVLDFITMFDDSHDTAALISFADDVTVNVGMVTGGFQQPIINAANGMTANGPTWSEGALQQALTTETSFAPPLGTNPQKVVVFFTDGLANTLKSVATCNSGSQKSGTWNIGGQDNNTGYSLFNAGNNNSVCSNSGCCAGTFTSLAGAQEQINWTDISSPVTGDASIRAVALANTMRLNNITVYAIGLGDGNAATVQPFLCQIANDPCSSTYDSTQLSGKMEWAPNAEALDQAFQTVASLIRLRLTQ